MPIYPPSSGGGSSLGLPLGLTGATSATRYVGATTSGAPVSGTFAVGDFIIDRTGAVYVCTAAGTPGTWAAIGAGGGALTRIQKITTAASQATVNFTGIPATYTDLCVTGLVRCTNASQSAFLEAQVNGDTGANYDDGSSGELTGAANVYGHTAQTLAILAVAPAASATAGRALAFDGEFPLYATTTFWRNGLFRIGSSTDGAGSYGVSTSWLQWRNLAAAINRITFFWSAGNFVDGSVVTLWGRT